MNPSLTLRGPLPVARATRQVFALLEGLRGGRLEVRLPDNVSRGILEFMLPDGTVRHEPVAHTEAPVQILNFSVTAP